VTTCLILSILTNLLVDIFGTVTPAIAALFQSGAEVVRSICNKIPDFSPVDLDRGLNTMSVVFDPAHVNFWIIGLPRCHRRGFTIFSVRQILHQIPC
jgi:hypothetical protein